MRKRHGFHNQAAFLFRAANDDSGLTRPISGAPLGEDAMNFKTLTTLGAFGAICLAASGPAFAGGCPAGKMGIDVRQPDTRPAKGVTDNVIASIDVAKEPIAIQGRLFRMRRLVIEPGGVVPWHSHGDRPAIIYVVSGEVDRIRLHLLGPDRPQGRRRHAQNCTPLRTGGKTPARSERCCSPPTCFR